MSHPEQLKFAELVATLLVPALRPREERLRVLEVGSQDVNGSVRSYFGQYDYVGADLSPGPGVDVVSSGHELNFADGHFDVTLSCECFEHNPYWKETFENMVRMTRTGGLVAVTCASRGRLEHGTRRTNPHMSPGTQSVGIDYYRNLVKKDFTSQFPFQSWFAQSAFWYIPRSRDLYFVGIKGSEPIVNESVWATFATRVEGIKSVQSSDFSPRMLTYRAIHSPLHLLSFFCDDTRFQSLAVPYDRAIKKISAGARSLFKGQTSSPAC